MNIYKTFSMCILGLSVSTLIYAEALSPLEEDWVQQLDLRFGVQQNGGITTGEDAVGAVDGVINGKWGFHTDSEQNPWWQVNLGVETAIDRIVVYNRADGTSGRASRIIVLVSMDGNQWQKIYQHDGSVFLGHPDNKPLGVKANGVKALIVRLQIEGHDYLHLDEVEVYGTADLSNNVALYKSANQSSVSTWSARHSRPGSERPWIEGAAEVLRRGRLLAEDLGQSGVDCSGPGKEFAAIEAKLGYAASDMPGDGGRSLYFDAQRTIRTLSFMNPILDFDRMLVTKRVHGSYSHMSDQYLGWWSRPGGGIYMMEKWKGDNPEFTCLTKDFDVGSFLRPVLSYDGNKVLFAYCKYYDNIAGLSDKVNKDNLPEDSFYHVYEMNVDGSNTRRLTKGKYNNFDAQYMPDGRIVFLSTRRSQFLQCGKFSAEETLTNDSLPESYVRCGGGRSRPCAVYTLHSMDGNGGDLIAISGFEMFEWTPSISRDGTIMYARWDYVDRHNNAFMSLWEANPDGTNPRHLYGNYTRNPHCIFEARSIPGSRKILATAAAHHSITAGSLILLDLSRGVDGMEPIKRLTPEVCFPEMEGWPASWFANPWPLSEKYYLTAWSNKGLKSEGGAAPANATGVYLLDVFGNLVLLHRDKDISTTSPLAVRVTEKPSIVSSTVEWKGPQSGVFMLTDIYRGVLKDTPRGSIKRLRVIGVPPKTQPEMNSPNIGIKNDDPGKVVLGTVPVEDDGSAYFRIPSGLTVFFQALDKDGVTIQTMRTGTYLMPGQTLSCVGCHESKSETPALRKPTMAASRKASDLTPGPDGSWPFRYDKLVQPVLSRACVECHNGKKDKPKTILTDSKTSYDVLINYGKVSLKSLVQEQLSTSVSLPNQSIAQRSSLLEFLRKGHQKVELTENDFDRFLTWMDAYAQIQGHFSDDQEQKLIVMRQQYFDNK